MKKTNLSPLNSGQDKPKQTDGFAVEGMFCWALGVCLVSSSRPGGGGAPGGSGVGRGGRRPPEPEPRPPPISPWLHPLSALHFHAHTSLHSLAPSLGKTGHDYSHGRQALTRGLQHRTSGAEKSSHSRPQGTVGNVRQGSTWPRTPLGPRRWDVATLGPLTAHCTLPSLGSLRFRRPRVWPAQGTSRRPEWDRGSPLHAPTAGSPWGFAISCPSQLFPQGCGLNGAPKFTSCCWSWGLGVATRV